MEDTLARRSMLTPEVKALVGTVSEPEANLFPISKGMVYDLADAIEFPHPLFLDEAYAKKSRFGGLLCPPLAAWKEWNQPINYFGAGQEGILEIPTSIKSYGFNGGAEWHFLRPAYVGDTMTRHYRVTDVYEKEGRSGLLVFVHREEIQANQKGQVVVRVKRVNIFRELKEEAVDTLAEAMVKLPPVSPPGRYEVVMPPRWNPQPQRYFEEVEVGQEAPPLVKGPVTTTHLVRWAAANGNYARIHWDLAFAMLHQKLPNLVVNGTLKNQYIGEMLMRFAGDEGWLKRYYIEHRGMDYAGDTLTAFGKITAVNDLGKYGLVEFEIGLRNQRGQQTAKGSAIVTLPNRGQRLPLEWE
jgi:acyl dehydratase